MKKILCVTALIAVLIAGLLLLTGCNEKAKPEIANQIIETITEPILGGWETILANTKVNIDEDTAKLFESAKASYTSIELEPVALLGNQVVAGTNRMFLAKGYQKGDEANAEYKMVIVYTDLQNNSSITKVTDFNYLKYSNENVEGNEDILAGGWTVSLPTAGARLDNNIQTAFDNATSTLAGVVYYPITTLGKQIVAGTNYAILCFGAPSYGEPERGTINVVTIYEDLSGSAQITSQAYVNLADFNK